ncbi:hypothetical protein [Chryseobacterium sp. 5_R23647]|uniref:hypothetical protein n=1 Tax=Chryseobacterium sp. 5_R23647 TaxID=2258964 RepID=UPI000E283933|nr:hypothetical protein [Chryseobacterium sp. 5_R23647]REC42590.1 hypothetical protein DRF69_11070 [Chryseobacterium sp. 5_R23647]
MHQSLFGNEYFGNGKSENGMVKKVKILLIINHKKLRIPTLKRMARNGKDSCVEVIQDKQSRIRTWNTGILLCAVPNADKLQLKYFAKKKQFIGKRYRGSGWKRNLRKRKYIA